MTSSGDQVGQGDESTKREKLSEEISRTALRLSSALTDDYKATLDAVRHLDHRDDQRAAERLRDAAMLARDGGLSDEFRELAERAEALP